MIIIEDFKPEGITEPDYICPGAERMIWFTVYPILAHEWLAYSCIQICENGSYYFGPTFVKPEWRGQGLQRMLIEAKEDYARRHGCKHIISSAYLDNTISINNMLKCGFKEDYRDETSIYLSKEI